MAWKLICVILFLCYGCHLNQAGDEEEEVDECEKKPDGLYAMRDYSKYMKCENRKRQELLCPKDYCFKADNRTCVPIAEMDLKTFCHGRQNGDYLNPWSDCTKYIHCVFGWSHVAECQSGLFYDPEDDACKDVSNSPHCNGDKESGGGKGTDENPIQQEENLITPEQLNEKLKTGNVRLIDVREPWEIEKFGKIDHSINIPVGDIENAFKSNENDFKTKYGIEKPSLNDCDLVFHCQSGIRSYKAMLIAKSLGYTCPKSLKGGHNAWKEMEDAMLSNCENPDKNENDPTSLITPQLLKEKLMATTTPTITLIDVRENWEIEKYGKIAQSVNIPVFEIENGFRMSDNDFKNRYHISKPLTTDCDLIFYCQSGIRGCKAVVMVKFFGYSCPKSLTGGYKAWVEMSLTTDNSTQTSNDLISSQDLKQKLQNGEVRLIDVREKWELDTEGKIAQSVNIPVADIESAFKLNDNEFKTKYGIDKPVLNDCGLVFHCKSGVRSYQALEIVRSLGYTCAKSLTGGFTAWKNLLS